MRKPHLFKIDLQSEHTPGHLYFADRAVKSTSAEPSFVCLDNALACQSSDSSVAVVLRNRKLDGAGFCQFACMRQHGLCAAFVFRHNQLILQGIGEQGLLTNELSLRHNDVFAIICGVRPQENVLDIEAAVKQSVRDGDLEYAAEEMLLRLRHSTEESTSIIARVSKFSIGLPKPPACSHLM